MSESNVVTVRGLRKRYGDRTVVDGFDLDVAAGEIVGLIGANGAGKTTAVECIQGLRRPDVGSLRVLGLDPVTEPDRLRTMIGSQLQSSALPDRLRVGEAVRLFSGRNGRELLEQFGLAGRCRSAFASLSGAIPPCAPPDRGRAKALRPRSGEAGPVVSTAPRRRPRPAR